MSGFLVNFFSLALFLCFVIGSYFLLRVDVVKRDKSVIRTDIEHNQMLSEVYLKEVEVNGLRYEVFADSAKDHRMKPYWEVEGVKVIFYGQGDTYTVTGKNAQIFVKDKNITVTGDVNMKTKTGYHFTSEKIHYLHNEQQILSHEFIKIYKTGKRSVKMSSGSMKVSLNDGHIYLDRGVRATRQTKKRQSISIKSEKAKINKKSGEANFFGNVGVKYAGLDIKGPKAKFKVNLKRATFDWLELTESVEVNDKLRNIKAKKMSFDVKRDIIRFSGNPIVKQGNDILYGSEIILKDKGTVLEVKRVKAKFNPNALEEK